MESFLDGHEQAFKTFSGVPRVLLYDNLRSAVLERQGDVIRFNPTLLSFAAHYRFEPRPVAVARGNEKGRVERSIRYVRDNFFAARTYHNLDDLNLQVSVSGLTCLINGLIQLISLTSVFISTSCQVGKIYFFPFETNNVGGYIG
jgi:hypothetical protein